MYIHCSTRSYLLEAFVYHKSIEPHLGALASEPAARSAPLESVGIACQTVILNTGQSSSAYEIISINFDTSQGQILTAVRSGRNAATALAVDIADVLLQTCVGRAACAVGNWAASVLGCWCRESERREGESDGESELHIC